MAAASTKRGAGPTEVAQAASKASARSTQAVRSQIRAASPGPSLPPTIVRVLRYHP